VSASGESDVQIGWRLRDPQSLERKLVLIYGDAPERDAWLGSVLDTFRRQLQDHPREWPVAAAPPSDHTFRFYGVQICYRVFPADKSVEVLSVSSLAPRR
jgi:hypothetical protein